ncbi:MAG: PadR family transcriptional regulator, partial [Candidatus Aenigmatarchaeota archaeon]
NRHNAHCMYTQKCASRKTNKETCSGKGVYICGTFNSYLKNELGNRSKTELGMLQMQILWMLDIRPTHGYDLMKRLNMLKQTKITQGTLYPALQRLKKMKMINSSKKGRKIIYHITCAGRKAMKESCAEFVRTFYGIFRHFGDLA